MTANYVTDEITFPSSPIDATTRATVEAVGNDWLADEDWRRFRAAVLASVAPWTHVVDPSAVRARLTVDGELTVNPRRLSAFYPRAVSQGLLEFSHWGVNDDHKGRNAGRPARMYKWVG